MRIWNGIGPFPIPKGGAVDPKRGCRCHFDLGETLFDCKSCFHSQTRRQGSVEVSSALPAWAHVLTLSPQPGYGAPIGAIWPSPMTGSQMWSDMSMTGASPVLLSSIGKRNFQPRDTFS